MNYYEYEQSCNLYNYFNNTRNCCCFQGPRGPIGPQGPEGQQGPQGPIGPPGVTLLTGIGKPDCSVGNNRNVYIDTLTGLTYYKMNTPVIAARRDVPSPTGTTHQVSSALPNPYDSIQNAINASSTLPGDELELIDSVYTLTSPLNITKSLTIKGTGINTTTIQKLVPSASPDYMVNVTASNVIFKDLKIMQNYPSTLSLETVVYINNINGTGYYFDNCEITSCEFGIGIKASEYQIDNCKFTYAPLASTTNGNRYIALYNSNGINIISNNTFRTQGGNNNCTFITITNVAVSSGSFKQQLIISNNIQDPTSPNTMSNFFNMNEYIGQDFQLLLTNNTTLLENNVPILFFNPNFNIFRYIIINNNKGRPPKDCVVTEEDKIAQLKYIIARKDAKIKRLEMETELMRDFLSLTGRK